MQNPRFVKPKSIQRATVTRKPVKQEELDYTKIPGYRYPGNSERSMNCTIDGLKDLIVIGYYTLGTGYQQEAGKLLASCERIGLNYELVGVKNLGGWQKNTRYKARFVKEMLLKYPTHRLLYVDCDAVFNKVPELFKGYKTDVAVRWQDFNYRKNECLSGTIYLENNLKTRMMCEKWISFNDNDPSPERNLEQNNLDKAISATTGLIIKNLPEEYTFIFDSMRRLYPDAKPVIEHFQASRKYKKQV